MKRYELLNKSIEVGALMDEDSIVYVLFIYRGHAFRLESGRLTAADDNDRTWASDYQNRHPEEF